MALTRAAIEAMAPDQAALKAAAGLIKPAKWAGLGNADGLVWGECQGSGANPYRVAADSVDPGSKCTCPSRKFPCKHGLALLWMFSENAVAFAAGEAPNWVREWMSRRRKPGTGAAPSHQALASDKSLAAALEGAPPDSAAPDPVLRAKRAAAAEKRAANTTRLVAQALEDLETWVGDQLRAGLPAFLAEAGDRCRLSAARLVDGKAGALASRVDEMPSRLLALPNEERADAAISELGKLVLLGRAWRAAPDDPELRREVVAAETREEVLGAAGALRVTSVWEALGEVVATRRDGLVSVATWLLEVGGKSAGFALLLDFFPASAGRRSGAFAAGERFPAEIVYYPARAPLRAVIAAREAGSTELDFPWPLAPTDPLAAYAQTLLAAPWRIDAPLLLPRGRLAADARGHPWWRAETGDAVLPLQESPAPFLFGARIEAMVGSWTGARFSLLAAKTDWGRVNANG